MLITQKNKTMIRYKKYQMTGEKSPLKGLWYARPVIEETFNIETLAKHMANHNTPYSAGVIKGVLADMISCIKELILDGKNVKLDDRWSQHHVSSIRILSVRNTIKWLVACRRFCRNTRNCRISLQFWVWTSCLRKIS